MLFDPAQGIVHVRTHKEKKVMARVSNQMWVEGEDIRAIVQG